MHKEIERAVLRITQAMEKNRKCYAEAKRSYADTGYDRYLNKMEKLNVEYGELRRFLHPEEKVDAGAETFSKLEELKISIKNIKSKWEYLRADLPVSADVIGIEDIFRDIKNMLS